MKQVKTGDGSITFHNEQYDETYHSITGAKEEALKKFVEPSNVKKYALNDEVNILDVCFGLGYNSAMAIDKILEANLGCKINIIGLENDIKILKKINDVNPLIQSYTMFKDLEKNNYDINEDGITIKIMIGDALKTIKEIDEKKQKFDLVFHDPFSPKKCPELWSEKLFKEIKKRMKQDSILTTYSCARIVRDNLKKAGFTVEDGPSVGRRAPSTIARPI